MSHKVAVVTGGAQGIGEATVHALYEDGFDVAILDLDVAKAQVVADQISAAGGRSVALECDVADEASVVAAIEAVVNKLGAIDALVNNAAVFIMEDIQASVEDWQRVMNVNVIGSALCVKHVVSHMRGRSAAAIVNVASISAHVAQPNFVTYNTSKAAILGLTRCLALDLAKDRIRVNAVSPGTTWTASNAAFCASRGINRAEADQAAHLGGAHILKRCAEPSEIAAAIAFLCSDKASFITGEILRVDGGYTAV
jgi:dihydroanticapsin dehydrogenase